MRLGWFYYSVSRIKFHVADTAAATAATRAVLLNGLSVTSHTAIKACTKVLKARTAMSLDSTPMMFLSFN